MRADLTGADLEDANLAGVDLTDTNLDDANLTRANLVHANLNDAHLYRVNLTGANLEGALIAGATFWECDLTDVNLGSEAQSVSDLGALKDADFRENAATVVTRREPKREPGAHVMLADGQRGSWFRRYWFRR